MNDSYEDVVPASLFCESTSASAPDARGPKIAIVSSYLQSIYRKLAFVTVLVPLLGSLLAVILLPYLPIGPIEIGILLVLLALTILGVEVGFHRYFAHRAFQTISIIQVMLAILGSMAAQGGVIYWIAHHRRHHQYTDLPGDPHSPNLCGTGFYNRLRGLWHGHVGWALEGEITNSMMFAKDLLRDPLVCRLNRLHHVWVLLGLVIPAVLEGVLTQTWIGVLKGFLWGGLVRVFLGQQIIWSTNSICHVFGDRPFPTRDRSTNSAWLAIPSFGQSWHNNHHAFQNSAVAGLEWWQVDPGTWVLRLLELVGLVWNLKVPTAEMKAAKINQYDSKSLDQTG